jgi:hypothetical protein
LKEIFAWIDFELALYQQMRMIYGGYQSTTIRFGLACLKAFEYVGKWAKEEMSAQADMLKEMSSAILNRLFTRCVSPIPDKFMIANFAHNCYYGVLYFEKCCTKEAKVIFKEYVTTSMTKKHTPNDIDHILRLHRPAS